jgi:hypothetical protein
MSDPTEPSPAMTTADNAGARSVPILSRGFLDGLFLARYAAGMLVRRPLLTVVVAILAGIGFFSLTFFTTHLAWHWPPSARLSPIGNPAAFWQPVWLFTAPLGAAAVTVVPLAWSPLLLLGGLNDASVGRYLLVTSAMSPLAFVLFLLVLVGLLGWVRDADKPLRISAWPMYWRRHYAPVILVTLILTASLVVSLLIGFAFLIAFMIPLVSPSLEEQRILNIAANGLPLIPAVIMMLAPFAAVAQGLRARSAIAESWRLLHNNGGALVALFLVFACFCVPLLLRGMPGVPEAAAGFLLGGRGRAPLWWQCLQYVGLALLGLWLAHAFMEIAKARAYEQSA